MARKLQIASFLLATVAILGLSGCWHHRYHDHDHDHNAPGLHSDYNR